MGEVRRTLALRDSPVAHQLVPDRQAFAGDGQLFGREKRNSLVEADNKRFDCKVRATQIAEMIEVFLNG